MVVQEKIFKIFQKIYLLNNLKIFIFEVTLQIFKQMCLIDFVTMLLRNIAMSLKLLLVITVGIFLLKYVDLLLNPEDNLVIAY